jgi:4-amino-4-deoxy-L-arabinose transferase-like glycosyltransferase
VHGADLGVPSANVAGKVVLASIVAFVVAGGVFLMRGTPFSGDEPLYGLRSRSFRWGETPWFAWPSYRAPGLPLLAAPFVGLPEPVLRAGIVCFAAASVALVYVLARTFVGQRAAAWAAVVFAGTPGLLASSVYFFPDVPGVFLVLVAVVSIVRYLLKEGSHGWLVLMCVSVTAAGLVRFSVGIVALAALVALLIAAPRALAAHRGRCALAGALLVAITAAGTFLPAVGSQDGLSPVAANRELLSQNAAPLSRRLVTLADTSSWAFGLSRQLSLGAVAGAVFLVACGTGLVVGLLRAARSRDRLVLFPIVWFLITLGFFLAALDHFEIRYLVPLFTPLAMVAGSGLSLVARRLTRPWATVLAAATLAAGLLFGTYLITVQLRADDAEDLAVRSVGDFVAAADHPCVMTFGSDDGKVWLLPWYSGCHASSGAGAQVYVAVWRDASVPASPPRADAELVRSEAFALTKQGDTQRRVIDVYRLPDAP